MRLVALVALFTAALLLVGCGERSDGLGGVPRERAFSRIVSLSPNTTEIVQTLAMQRLVGRTAACNFPPGIAGVPVVMEGIKPDLEKLTEVAPDMVVFDKGLFGEDDIAKLKSLGAEVFEFDGSSIDNYLLSLGQLAVLIGNETRASELADEVDAARNRSLGAPVEPTPKVAVLIGGGATPYMIAGQSSFQADVVRATSGEPVGPDAPNFVDVNLESLVALNPDIILSSDSAEEILNDPRLASVAAVRNKAVFDTDPDVLLRAGTRVATLIRSIYDVSKNVKMDVAAQ